MKFALYFGVLLQGKMANDNGLVSIAGAEEIPIINVSKFKVNSFIQCNHVTILFYSPRLERNRRS